MYRHALFMFGIALAVVSAPGCADSSATTPQATPAPRFRLVSEPAGALEVLDAREQATDGEAIVVVGRLGGGLKPWIEGRAAFLLVDTRIQPSCEDDGPCPEDCQDCAKEMLAASTMVKFLDGDGKVLSMDARTLLGVKELETVVVEGVARRDETGNVSIAAKGLFVRR